MKNIQVFVADTLNKSNNIELADLIALLPSNLQARALRYNNKRSSVNYCFGRLMLQRAISDLGFDSEKINELYYSPNDKPLIDGFYFSISHSENIVALAFSTRNQLGLDIEKIQTPELTNFKSFFRDDEWKTIISDTEPLVKFYWYWVRKESILKAIDGKMNQVNDIFIASSSEGYFKTPEINWYLHEINIGEKHKGILACRVTKPIINIEQFKLI